MKNDSIKFDPGFDSIGQIGYVYYTFCAIQNVKLKKINFPHTLRKIENLLKINISFYLGCLLWACFIKQFDKKIEGNMLLGETCEEKEYTNEINFLIELIEKNLPKDSKYYLNKPYETNEKYLNILKTYKNFLILNEGFVNCDATVKILLPQNIKKPAPQQLQTINETIQNAIEKKDLTMLFEIYDTIF